MGRIIHQSIITSLALVTGVLGLAYWHDRNQGALPESKTQNEIQADPPDSPQLSDITLASGIDHSHLQLTGVINDMKDSLGASACAGDFDQDGWVDIAFIIGQGDTRYFGRDAWWSMHKGVVFYKNDHGRFIRQHADLPPLQNIATTGCLAADFDNDGLTDILLLTSGENSLWKNEGGFRFSATTSLSGISHNQWTTHAAVTDINQDGLLDIYLTHYLNYRKNIQRLEMSHGFTQQYDQSFTPQAFDGLRNQLLINQGTFEFKDVTSESGLGEHSERTLSALWVDLDDDGMEDLIEFNDNGNPIRVYRQSPRGHFSEIDLDMAANSTRQGLLIISPENNKNLFATRQNGYSNLYYKIDANGITLKEHSWESGLNDTTWTYLNRWGAIDVDLINDSSPSIIIATGLLRPDPYAPSTSIGQPNQCFQLDKRTKQYFLFPCSEHSPIDSTRSVIDIDINNDGKMDLIFSNNNDYPQVLLNNTHSYKHWIKLDLTRASELNGGTLRVSTDIENIELKITPRAALFGNSDPRFHFGLGASDVAHVSLSNSQGNILYEGMLNSNSIYTYNNGAMQVLNPSKPGISLDRLSKLPPSTLVRVLSHSGIHPQALPFLKSYFSKNGNATNIGLSRYIRANPARTLLPLYEIFIDSGIDELSLASLNAMKQLEDEQSLDIVKRALYSESSSIVCGATDLLEHWYREEEAVTRKKYRLIPDLMRLLDNKDSIRVACSANALSESDNTTAAHALITKLHIHSGAAQASIARALGKLRHTSAIPHLLEAINTSSNTIFLAESIVTLSRLGYTQLDPLIEDISRKHGETFLLSMLYELAANEDTTVIPRQQTMAWLRSASRNANTGSIGDAPALLSLFTAYQEGIAEPDSDFIAELTNHPDILVRESAAQFLMKTGIMTDNHLSSIMKRPLSPRLYDTIRHSASALTPILSNTQLNSHVISMLPTLSDSLKSGIVNEWIVNLELRVPDELRHKYLGECLGSKTGFEVFRNVGASYLPISNQDFRICFILSEAKGTDTEMLRKLFTTHIDKLTISEFIDDLDTLADFLLNQPTSSIALRNISAILLSTPSIPIQIKDHWGLLTFEIESYAREWALRSFTSEGNYAYLEQLLLHGGYKHLSGNPNAMTILENEDLPISLRALLLSEQASFNNTRDTSLFDWLIQ